MNKKDTVIVNLFGAPGTGKTTSMCYIFSKLKMAGISAEMATEYAKDKLWEGSTEVFNDQLFIFANQNFRISKLLGKVDVIITDSPILLSWYYNKDKTDHFFKYLILDRVNKQNAINYLLKRVKPYDPIGRFQNEAESNEIATDIEVLMDNYLSYYSKEAANEEGCNNIVDDLIYYFKGGQNEKLQTLFEMV